MRAESSILTKPSEGACGLGTPSFSVILCVHRTNPWLAMAIDSVLQQTDSDFEFLIAANACSDDFWSELQTLTSHDSRVRLFRSSIGQLTFNLNLLADQAQGDYLVRMDADDVSEPQRLQCLRRALARDFVDSPVDILGSAAMLIDGNGNILGQMNFPETTEEIRRALKSRTVFCHPAVAIRRAFLIQMRGYLGGFASEDSDLWIRAASAGVRMENLPEVLLRYRVHDQQSIATKSGYAEMAGHWLRELILHPGLYTLHGFCVALFKALSRRFLPGIQGYKSRMRND